MHVCASGGMAIACGTESEKRDAIGRNGVCLLLACNVGPSSCSLRSSIDIRHLLHTYRKHYVCSTMHARSAYIVMRTLEHTSCCGELTWYSGARLSPQHTANYSPDASSDMADPR
jgi:hypothetical protein